MKLQKRAFCSRMDGATVDESSGIRQSGLKETISNCSFSYSFLVLETYCTNDNGNAMLLRKFKAVKATRVHKLSVLRLEKKQKNQVGFHSCH